ncbi:MAG: hypothetical protein MJZ21_04790, partial [archaeon]|nr:hypothetical protein [archaeon]
MDRRSIDRILSGQVNEFWDTRPVKRRGKMALVEIETGVLRGFGNLDDVSEMPYSEYYQYYGMKRHRCESVPSSNGTVKAYRFRLSGSYLLTD